MSASNQWCCHVKTLKTLGEICNYMDGINSIWIAGILPSDSDRADDDRPWAPKQPTKYPRKTTESGGLISSFAMLFRKWVIFNEFWVTWIQWFIQAECSTPTRQTGGCWFVFCYFSISFIGGVFHPFLSFRARFKWWTVQRVLELQTIEKQRCTKETHPKNILKNEISSQSMV